MNKIDGKTISIKLSNEVLGEIERVSKLRKIPKTEVTRMFVEGGMVAHQEMEKLGIVRIFNFVEHVKNSLKGGSPKGKSGQLSLY